VSLETMSADVQFVQLQEDTEMTIGEFMVKSIPLARPSYSMPNSALRTPWKKKVGATAPPWWELISLSRPTSIG
jgi:hypothetical protein